MEKNNLNHLIGKRLRDLREKRHLSLEQASEVTGVSKPMLGQIERGQSNPTVSTLWKIADGLGVPFTAFIDEVQPDVKQVAQIDLVPINEADDKYKVYPIFPMLPGKYFEIFSVVLEPYCHYESKPHPKGVEEYLWVTEGETIIELNDQEYTVRAQEGISFTADRDHHYINKTDQPSKLVLVIHYPNH